jgi:hypothetical protein
VDPDLGVVRKHGVHGSSVTVIVLSVPAPPPMRKTSSLVEEIDGRPMRTRGSRSLQPRMRGVELQLKELVGQILSVEIRERRPRQGEHLVALKSPVTGMRRILLPGWIDHADAGGSGARADRWRGEPTPLQVQAVRDRDVQVDPFSIFREPAPAPEDSVIVKVPAGWRRRPSRRRRDSAPDSPASASLPPCRQLVIVK